MSRFFSFLWQVIRHCWTIILYFVVRGMDLTNKADQNRQVLTLSMLLQQIYGSIFVLLAVILAGAFLFYDSRNHLSEGAKHKVWTVFAVGFVIGCFYFTYVFWALSAQTFSLNDDLTEAEANLPTQSNFLKIVYFIFTVMTFFTLLLWLLLSCASSGLTWLAVHIMNNPDS